MNNKTFVMAALALGLVAAVLNYVYLSQSDAEGVTVLKVKPNVSAKAGMMPESDWFERITIKGNVPELSKLVVTDAEAGNYMGKVPLTEPLRPGDLLYLSSFSVHGDSGPREGLLPGERAISVTVGDEAKAAAYFVRPGDQVDIWGTFGGQAIILKERARVGAVGESYKIADSAQGDRAFRTVTLLVPETDVAPLLTNIQVSGGITLSLVGPADSKLQPKPATQSLASMASQLLGAQANKQSPKGIVMPTETKAPPPAPAPSTSAAAPATPPQ